MKRGLVATVCFFLCTGVLVLFSGCSGDTAGRFFSFGIPAPVKSLDPQYATDASARMIISNIFQGLMVQMPDGSLKPGAAESYEISPDGLRYTFYLRQEAGWAGEVGAVKAEDFVFAFRRLFNPAAPSPFAKDYIHIKDAADVLAGNKSERALGIQAEDEYTLVITLEQESPFFLQLLSETAAMPCSREFFDAAKGRYGLEIALTGSNGPFYISRWTDKQITLLPNENYDSGLPVLAGGANFYIGRNNTGDIFPDGGTDVAMIPYDRVEQVLDEECTIESFDKTTWCIVFNQRSQTWGNALLRQALARAVDYSYFSQRLEGKFKPSSVLIPPAALLGDKPYRAMAGSESPLEYNPASAARIYNLGLDALEYSTLPSTVFYVPETDGHALNMGFIQQGWQKDLSVFVTVKPIPLAEINNRFASGDYQMMLMPISQDDARLESLLSVFTSSSAGNGFGYKNPWYDQMILDAQDQLSVEAAARKYEQAEKTLLVDAVIIPVYTETTYYATAKGVSGVGIYPFGEKISFKSALRA